MYQRRLALVLVLLEQTSYSVTYDFRQLYRHNTVCLSIHGTETKEHKDVPRILKELGGQLEVLTLEQYTLSRSDAIAVGVYCTSLRRLKVGLSAENLLQA